MPEIEFSEKWLQQVVEARWGKARSQVVPIPGAGYLAQVCTKAHEHFVKVAAPTAEKAAGMAVAAVLAPELLALVKAARNLREGQVAKREAVADDQEWKAERRIDAAELRVDALLARLPEEVICPSSE